MQRRAASVDDMFHTMTPFSLNVANASPPRRGAKPWKKSRAQWLGRYNARRKAPEASQRLTS